MSDSIQTTPAAVQRRLTLSLGDYKAVVKRPLLALPEDVRPAALALWTCHKHLKGLETALPIAGMFSVWIEQHGLRPDDAAAVMRAALHPGKMQAFEFAGQLITRLAADVAATLARRERERTQADHAAKVSRWEAEKVGPAELAAVRERLADIGEIPFP